MKSITRNTFVYLLANFLVTVAYSMPHSILTVILLSKGLSLSQILIVQSAYSIAIVLCEFPSGLIADNYSRKNIYSLSKLFLIVMFLIVLFSNNFYLIFAAWFCYGIASALDTKYFPAFYIAFQIITLFSYSINIDGIKKYAGLIKFCPLIIFLPLTFLSKHLWVLLPAYFIFIFVFYVIEFILNYYFNKMVSIDNISSLVSFKSTISRLGSICLLCLLSLMVKVFAVEKVMAVNFMASLLFLFLLVIIWLRKQPKLTK